MLNNNKQMIGENSLFVVKQKYKKDIEESAKWQLKTIDDKGQNMVALIPYIEFDSDGSFRSIAPNKADGYKDLKGTISKEGIADMRLRLIDSSIMEFTGKLIGQNRILGNWTLKNISFGQFELSMIDAVPYQFYRSSNDNNAFTDYYYLNFTRARPKVQGIGIDDAGVYIILGRLKEKKLKMFIYYLGKFQIKIKGKHDPKSPVVEVKGKWKNYAKGYGDFTLSPLQPGFQVPPLGAFTPTPMPTPFNPQPIEGTGQYAPPVTEIHVGYEAPRDPAKNPFEDTREHAK